MSKGGSPRRASVCLLAFHPLVPRIIREFRKAFPLVAVTLAESNPTDLIERMQPEPRKKA